MSDYKRLVREKVKAQTEQELYDKAGSDFRVVKVNWDGPGWYLIYHYSQRCPRGCCYDDVFEALSVEDRAYELQSEIRGLASDLSELRKLQNQGEEND